MIKELKALDILFDFIKSESEEELYKNYYNEIKNALIALELIEGALNIKVFEAKIINEPENSHYYIEICDSISFALRSREEYDLLKEVL